MNQYLQEGNQVVAETDVGSQEVAATSENETDTQPQTLYVAIQPGANMESGQGDQPAVYLEVVEAGSGTEVTSSDGQVNLVQEEMVIDNGNWWRCLQQWFLFNCWLLHADYELYQMLLEAADFQFFKPPRETKLGSRNWHS